MCEDLPGGGAPADRRRSAAAVATATVAMATSPRFDTAAEWIIDATPLVPAATARCQGIRRHLNYKENSGSERGGSVRETLPAAAAAAAEAPLLTEADEALTKGADGGGGERRSPAAARTAALPALRRHQAAARAPVRPRLARRSATCAWTQKAADGRRPRRPVYVCVRARVRVCAAAAAVDAGEGLSRGRERRAAPRPLARPVTGHRRPSDPRAHRPTSSPGQPAALTASTPPPPLRHAAHRPPARPRAHAQVSAQSARCANGLVSHGPYGEADKMEDK
ncbi:uncharacterized protein [Penaeus vannamei]|uniref:uncharacterized protein n=1 Tax=Penaeus vannamei TaxID=6689 RepID=UPI00387F83B2